MEQALQKKFKKSPYAKLIVDDDGLEDSTVPELSQAGCMLREEVLDTVFELAEDRQSGSLSHRSGILRKLKIILIRKFLFV